jgi:NSS family neurotransmitter:Na+ symporter
LMNMGLRIKRSTFLLIISVCAFLIGLLYMRQNGMYVMDIVVYFGNYSIMTDVLIQSIAVGWIYDAKQLRSRLNMNSSANITPVFDFSLKYIIPVVLFTFIIKQASEDLSARYENYALSYLLIYGIGMLLLVGLAGALFNALDSKKQRSSH